MEREWKMIQHNQRFGRWFRTYLRQYHGEYHRWALAAMVFILVMVPAYARAQNPVVRDIQFHRTMDGSARIVISHSGQPEWIEVGSTDQRVHVRFDSFSPDPHLRGVTDIEKFATPAKSIELSSDESGVALEIDARSPFYPTTTHRQGEVEIMLHPVSSSRVVEDKQPLDSPYYQGELMSLSFQQISVREALQIIADFTGLNVVTSDSVEGDLSLRLKDVPWDQALDVILQSKGLAKRRRGNIIWVAPSDEIVAKEKQSLELMKAAGELEPLVSALIRVRYAKAEDMAALIKSVRAVQTGVDQSIFGAVSVSETKTEENSLLSDRGSVTVDSRTNALLIQDTKGRLEELKSLIRRLDIPVRQVQIETRIITARESFSKNLGVRFGFTRIPEARVEAPLRQSGLSIGGQIESTNPLGDDRALSINLPADTIGGEAAGRLGFTLATIGSGFLNLLDLEISALQAEGNGRVLANPKILTTDKRRATIEQGQERLTTFGNAFGTSSTKGQKAVLSLTVLPQITPDNKVILDVDITNDAFVSASEDTVNTQRINTQTLLHDGETVVIGGIYTQEQWQSVAKVPVIGDIPYLGGLFRKRQNRNSRSELLIFLTPHIIDSPLLTDEADLFD